MSTSRRKKEIARIRTEGYEAARLGRHYQTNPYPEYSSDRHQWWAGYLQYQREQQQCVSERIALLES